MAIKIVPKFTKADITKAIASRLLRIHRAIVLRLHRVAETFVRNARENGSYNDVTGNLRNSIGYVILRNGEVLESDFRRSAQVQGKVEIPLRTKVSKGSRDGVNAGKDLAFEIARKYPKGYVLIVVAGMEYAAAVESRGREVLTASSLIAENDLRVAFQNLDKKIRA